MSTRAVTATSLGLELGEGPVWDARREEVLWVDSEAGEVYRGRLMGDNLEVTDLVRFEEKVGSVAPTVDGGMLVAGEHQVHVVAPDGRVMESIRLLPQEQRSRLNDGVVDPAGRFLVGSIRLDDRVRDECLWSIDADLSVRKVVGGITVSNGIGFAPDGSTMFYVETRPGAVLAFDYDVQNGQASNRRVVLDCGGTPDGLAVDAEGCLWVAFFGEGQVWRLSPQGDVLDTIHVPAPNVTCPTFVGSRRDRLIIASARFRMSERDLEQWPASGAMFVADVHVPGVIVPAWAGTSGS